MKILVTGASGVIGRHAAAALQSLGHEVHAVGRAISMPACLPPGIVWHRFDLLHGDPAAVIGQVAPEAALHLAWVTAHGAVWSSAENLDWVGSSLRLLRAFAEAGGRRFVAAGTCAEYDWARVADQPCREQSTPLGGSSLYGAAKDSFRRCAERYSQTRGLSFAWGRVFHLFGEGEAEGRLFPSLVSSLRASGCAAISHGRQIRDITSSQEIGTAFARLVVSPAAGIFNVASGRAISIGDFALAVAAKAGGEIKFGALAAPENEPAMLVADVSRLEAAIGYVPGQDLHADVARLVEAFQT